MTNDQIKVVLSTVVEQVLDLVPTEFRTECKNNMYIAGGAIVSLVLNEPPHDFDVFLETERVRDIFKDVAETCAKAEVVANTQNAITFRLNDGQVVQVVTRFLGPPSRVFDSFDFTMLKCYYKPEEWHGVVQEAIPATLILDRELIESRKLTYDGKKDVYTLNTLKRLAKFCRRGFTPDNESIVNLHIAIQNRPHISKDPSERAVQSCGFYGSSFT